MMKEIAAVGAVAFAAYMGYDKLTSGTWFWQKPPFSASARQMQQLQQQAQINSLVNARVMQEVARREQQRKQIAEALPKGRYATSHSQAGYSNDRWSQTNDGQY